LCGNLRTRQSASVSTARQAFYKATAVEVFRKFKPQKICNTVTRAFEVIEKKRSAFISSKDYFAIYIGT